MTIINANDARSSLFKKPRPAKIFRREVKVLIELLEADDTSLVRFSQEIGRYPSVLKQLLRAANSSLTGSAVEITTAAHATLFLGSRRVIFLLNTLPPELIEDDPQPTE